MKVRVGEKGDIVLEEVYNPIILETEEGNKLSVCMRDDTFEIGFKPLNNPWSWHRPDVESRLIHKIWERPK